MSDLIILACAAIAIFGLLKVYSNKLQDEDGRTILTTQDRIIGFIVLAFAGAGIMFVKIGMYGIGNPLILASPVLIGIVVLLNRSNKRKNTSLYYSSLQCSAAHAAT